MSIRPPEDEDSRPREGEDPRPHADDDSHPSEGEDPLFDLAGAITDGEAVDWEDLARSHPDLAGRIDRLRAFRAVAAALGGVEETRAVDADAAAGSAGGASGGAGAVGATKGTSGATGGASGASSGPTGVSSGERSGNRSEGSPEIPFAWGSLQVIEKVGSGGFGDVYRAIDTVLQRPVALKLRRLEGEEETAAFQIHLDEARRLARVRHPNVLTVHGVEIHDGRAGMWTDFIEGESLEQRLRREGPFPIEDLVRIGRDLSAALNAVHEAGLVHGDIKTANAMIDVDGTLVLMDFGAGARLAGPDGSITSSPQGTPIAMSWELLEGGAPTIASDIYALGVLLFRLATGRYPIEATGWRELRQAHREGQRLSARELRPDLPETAALAIDRALAREPDARPRDARELGAYFRAASPDVLEMSPADRAQIAGQPPFFTSRFVGRRREMAELRRLLLDPGLITLCGPGGAGKTRLALEIATEAAIALTDGACWVDLSELGSDELLGSTVARALGVKEPPRAGTEAIDAPDDAITRALEGHLASRSMLLVLDNCEHMIGAVRELTQALAASPRLRVLVTTREPIASAGERVLPLGSLEVPPAGADAGLEVLDADAVRLFVDRATRQRPGFVLTPPLAPVVARIVRRLDGIPLAIELAAARVGALTPEQIDVRLEESFRLILGRESTETTGHRTLLASIEWSYRMLSPEEQRCFLRASVFSGGWTLEAAEAICGDPEGASPRAAFAGGIDGEPVLDLLEDLVRRSMVQFDAHVEPPRYRLLAMVRSFAAQKLQESGEEATVRERHLAWFLALAERADRQFTPALATAMGTLESEIENLRAAIAWAKARPGATDVFGESGEDATEDREEGASERRLCQALRRFWFARGSYREGFAYFSHAAERPGLAKPRRAEMILGAASLLWPIGDLNRARELAERAERDLRDEDDPRGARGGALSLLGHLADLQGTPDKARAYLQEALRVHEARNYKPGVATISSAFGVLETRLGQHASALPHFRRSLPLLRELGDESNAALVQQNMSYCMFQLGDVSGARTLLEEGIAVLRRLGQRRPLAAALTIRAEIALAEGKPHEARIHGLEAIHLARETNDRTILLVTLTTMGGVVLSLGDARRAALLLGAAEAIHQSMHVPIGPGEEEIWQRRRNEIEAQLGAELFPAVWAEGRSLDLDAAIEIAAPSVSPGDIR